MENLGNIFKIIDEMVNEKIIHSYALGGAMATVFYLDPADTEDLDIFINYESKTGLLVSLSPVYQFLENKGFFPHKEWIEIFGFPVQLIPCYNDLVCDAVENAREVQIENQTIRVISPEFLVAIMFQTGRPKDVARIQAFVEAGILNTEVVRAILTKYQIPDKWNLIKN